MKLAIFLTGLIIDKRKVLPHIKRIFDFWAETNNIEIDIYCHFWDSESIYPYHIDYNSTKITVPWENAGSVNYAIDILKPVDYTISKFTDTHNYFLKYINALTEFQPNSWNKDIQDAIISEKFLQKNIHTRYFVEESNNCVHDFNLWWSYHVRWCQFIHVISQAYTTHKALQLIINSDKTYDAVLKWRYDLLCDYKTHNDKIINAMHTPFVNPTYTSDITWEGLNWKSDFDYSNDIVPGTALISLADSWFILNNSAIKKMSQHYLNNYAAAMNTIFLGKEGGQHTYCHDGVRHAGVSINLINRIQETIIRFPEKISEEFHDDPHTHCINLYHTNFLNKNTSDYKKTLDYWDERSKFYTIKYFDFY
jgi:hypothetical protein